METLQNSEHYVWSTAWKLGKGATCTVYQGMHKRTGESVAVKVFDEKSQLRPQAVVNREFEVLQRLTALNHDNIVKMLAQETEVESDRMILVTELCTGGSLYSILDDPQNSYGLEEEEFLCVLKDLSAGIKYLRENSVVHRDLKPGNIMKFIKEDGSTVYKLIDFGAARELGEDEPYQSMYGTEEYLHPVIYSTAVLKYPTDKPFRCNLDIWSIGATLYHVATGSLPFRAYGGRKNRGTMYSIIRKKGPGVISGVQHSENGPIEWSKELPKTCLLSQGNFRELLTNFLARIYESEQEKLMTFDQFLYAASDIISRKVIHVFYMNEGKEINLYMPPNSILKDVKEQIAVHMKVPPANQILLFNETFFECSVDPCAEVSTYPVNTYDNPLILLHSQNPDVKDMTRFGTLSKCFPMLHVNSVNLDHDAAQARICCVVAHVVKRHIEQMERCQNLLLRIPKILLTLTARNVTKLCSDLAVIEQRTQDLDQRFSRLENSYLHISEYVSCWPSEHKCENDLWTFSQLLYERKQLKEQGSQNFLSLQSAISTLERKVMKTGVLQKEWDQAASECLELTGCVERADAYVNKIRESWTSLLRDRNSKVLSFHGQQFHILEKVRLQQTSKKLSSLLQDECVKFCLLASQKLDEWYSGMQAAMVQCKCLQEDTNSLKIFLQEFCASLTQAETEADNLSQKILSELKASKLSNAPSPPAKLPSSDHISVRSNGHIRIRQGKNASLHDIFDKLDNLSISQSCLRELVEEHDTLIEKVIQEKSALASIFLNESKASDT